MNILSLFDGMSCGQIALKELGVKVDKYYASEVDKFAIEQTKLNFPNTIHLGDITKWKEWNVNWSRIDLVIGGFCCQSFSMAGHQKGFDDERGQLFFIFADIIDHILKHNPNAKFLGENVKMAGRHQAIIDNRLGVHPVEINSSLVSAQNRVRLYWSNIRTKEVGLFGERHTDIPQPEDKDIYLKDILEDEVDDKYYLSDKMIKGLINRPKPFDTFNPVPLTYGGKSRCTTAIEASCVAMRGRENGQQLEKRYDGKTNRITSVQKDNYVLINRVDQREPKIIVDTKTYKAPKVVANTGEKFEQESRVFSINGKSPTILSNNPQEKSKILEGRKIRRLTPTECARLQTIPGWYKWGCSDTQQYKMLGNGWTVDVIKHIFSFL